MLHSTSIRCFSSSSMICKSRQNKCDAAHLHTHIWEDSTEGVDWGNFVLQTECWLGDGPTCSASKIFTGSVWSVLEERKSRRSISESELLWNAAKLFPTWWQFFSVFSSLSLIWWPSMLILKYSSSSLTCASADFVSLFNIWTGPRGKDLLSTPFAVYLVFTSGVTVILPFVFLFPCRCACYSLQSCREPHVLLSVQPVSSSSVSEGMKTWLNKKPLEVAS